MFNIGDKVRVKNDYDDFVLGTGVIGIVKIIKNGDIGVEFDTYKSSLHDIHGYGKSGHCWFFRTIDLEKIGIKKRKQKPLIIPESIYKRDFSQFRYGIELETIVPYENDEDSYSRFYDIGFESSEDGSIEYNDNEVGIEFKNENAVKYEKLIAQADRIESIANDLDMRVNTSTGFHVHMSHDKFTNKKYLSRIISTWLAIEDFMYSTQPNSRQKNSYCKKHFVDQMNSYFDNIPNSKQGLIDKFSGVDRYYSLNFNALAEHGTIECRLHAGTLNSTKIKAWVYLLSAFYEYCLSDSFSKDEIEKLYFSQFTSGKVKAIYKLLKIPRPLQYFFNRRIKKMDIKSLQKDRFQAIESYKSIQEFKKIQKEYQKSERKLYEKRKELESLQSNSSYKFDQLNLTF